MKRGIGTLAAIGGSLALASAGPLIFPAAQAGYSSLSAMAVDFLLPSLALLAILAGLVWKRRSTVARAIVWGAAAGAVATVALEIVRLIGFHYDLMPGNLPRLMGVLLLDRFALGPSTASDIAGWAYHFWNGASFGIIYILLLGTRRRWAAVLYGAAIGIGFMVSPVVVSLGVGYFGLQFSIGFPITVTLAHVAFGAALGILSRSWMGSVPSPLLSGFSELLHGESSSGRTAA